MDEPRIEKLFDGSGENYIVGENRITKIEDATTSSPKFSIYKNNRLWRTLYLPKVIIEYFP